MRLAISSATSIAASLSLIGRWLLNPNLATAWFLSGWLRVFRGEPDVAIEHFGTRCV